MERELILTIKEKYRLTKKMNAEVRHIQKMLPEIESFEAFKESHEVFDLRRKKVVKKWHRLFQVYQKGTEKNVFLFILNKN